MPPKVGSKKKIVKKKINKNVPLPTTPDELEEVLCKFLTADNNITAQALEILKAFLETPQSIPAMLQRMAESPRNTSRQLAAVLLCKRIQKHWKKLPDNSTEMCRQLILDRLINEDSLDVRRSVAALACVVARRDLPRGKWNTLLEWLWAATGSENPAHRDTCLRILRSLIDYCPEVMAPHFVQLRQLFETFVSDPNATIRHRALSGLNTLFSNYKTDEELMSISAAIVPITQVMDLCMAQDDDDSLGVILDMFTSMIELDAIDENIHKIFTNVVTILVDVDAILTLRGQASSFIVEYAKSKPGMFSKYSLTNNCIDAIIRTFIEEDENPFDTAETVPQRLGIEMLEVFMQYLPRSTIFNKSITIIQEFMVHADPYYRKAAYVLIAMLAEGTTELLAEYEEGKALNYIINYMCQTMGTDSSDLVKSAAAIALTNLSDNISDEVAENHAVIIPTLLNVLEGQMVETVRRKFVLALDAACETLGPHINNYLNPLMAQLNKQLQSPDLEVQETAINAIASTAMSANEGFIPFYDVVMDYLITVVNAPDSDEHVELKSKAICCISTIAKAVGPNNWNGKIEPLVGLITPYIEYEDYSYRDAVLHFLGNIIASLGNKTPKDLFENCFHMCLEIIKSVEGLHMNEDEEEGANLKGFSDDEADEAANAEDDDDDYNDFMNNGLTMDVGALDEKLSAFRTLSHMISALGAEFLPYLEETYLILTEVVNFPFDGIRKAAMIVLGDVLSVIATLYPNPAGVVKGVNNPMHHEAVPYVENIISVFIECIATDTEQVVVAAALDQVMNSFHKFGMAIIPADNTDFTTSILDIVQEQAPCIVNSEWNDIEGESNEFVLDSVCDLLGVIAQYMGPVMKPFYDQCLPHVLEYCTNQRPDNFRSMAIGGIAEVIDLMGAVCNDYVPQLFPIAINYLNDNSIEVRRNSAYLAGVLAQAGGESTTQYLAAATEGLIKLTHLPEDETKHTSVFMGCRDNAVAALCKFCVSNPKNMPLAQFLPIVVQGIPFKDDVIEGNNIYPMVCQLFEVCPEVMMPLIPQVVNAFTQILPQPSLNDEARAVMVQLLKSLVEKFATDMQGVVAALAPHQQEAFNLAMQ